MNDEQEKRLADIERRFPNHEQAEGWFEPYLSIAWLLALVKEMREENARLQSDRPIFDNAPGHSIDMTGEVPCVVCPFEQQLAAVTAEREVARADALGYLVRISEAVYPGSKKHPAFDSAWVLTELNASMDEFREQNTKIETLEAERDELRREVERLNAENSKLLIRAGQEAADCQHARLDMLVAQQEKEKAEAERDALRAGLATIAAWDERAPAAAYEMQTRASLELARLKGGT